MSFFGEHGSVRSRSNGRAVMLIGVVLAALIWSGLVPPASGWVHRADLKLRDRLSLMLPPPAAREDLVFVGIDDETRRQSEVTPEVARSSRALTLMRREVGNDRLDRRIYAELVERLVAAGAKLIVIDVLFVGSSGDPAIDREFAEVLHRHHDKVILSMILTNRGDGSYVPISSAAQLPLLSRAPERVPREGYVNLWPDAEDNIVRHMDYTVTLGELQSGDRQPDERVYESLAALTGRLLGADLPDERSPRLRYAASPGEEGTFAAAYAPHSLHHLFVPERWESDYGSGEFFRDKVVLVSTAALQDDDYHPIPGGFIYGGQFHLQALGSLLDDNFWQRAPGWVNLCALLGMAAMAVTIGLALRHPLAILLAALAVGGGFVVLCAWLSGFTGVLFAGTPGLLGLAVVTVCAELGHLVARAGGKRVAGGPARERDGRAIALASRRE